MTFLIALALFVLLMLVLAWAAGRLSGLRREVQSLSRRLEALERGRSAPGPPATAPDVPVAHAPVAVAPAHVPRPAARPADAEQWIGSVGLQNAGSVLLLVGFFFLVLWGYTTGRFGPLVLVAAGVLTGIGVAWRGDRLRRTVLGLGDALLGVGAGIVWLSLYLGWTTLHALPSAGALPLLFVASALTGALGLRYRVEGISALGLIGAFLPHLLRFVVTLPDAPLPAWSLFGYLVSINVLVSMLAMRSGWNRLALASVLLTAVTWSSAVATDRWSWPLEIGLTGLFLALGIASLPRLVRVDGRVRPVDLALIATAPVALLAASWPMFSIARSEHVAILLGTLAAIYLALALAVDLQRPERDLWRALTAAATLFLTGGIERAVGPEYTGLAWAVEGAALAWLGLAPRSSWLRGCGSAVALAAVSRVLPGLFAEGFANVHPVPFVHAQAVREAVVIAALLFGAWRLERAASTPGSAGSATAGSWERTCCSPAGSCAKRITWRGRWRPAPACGVRSGTSVRLQATCAMWRWSPRSPASRSWLRPRGSCGAARATGARSHGCSDTGWASWPRSSLPSPCAAWMRGGATSSPSSIGTRSPGWSRCSWRCSRHRGSRGAVKPWRRSNAGQQRSGPWRPRS